MAEKTEKKQISWRYVAMSHTLIMVRTDEVEVEFFLTDLVKDMTNTQELGFQYGIKQWVSSGFASEPRCVTDDEKTDRAKEMIRDLKEYGFFLTESGTQMKIASPENLEGKKTGGTKALLTKANNMIDLMKKRMTGQEMTEDENKWLDEMLATYK